MTCLDLESESRNVLVDISELLREHQHIWLQLGSQQVALIVSTDWLVIFVGKRGKRLFTFLLCALVLLGRLVNGFELVDIALLQVLGVVELIVQVLVRNGDVPSLAREAFKNFK